MVKVTNDDDVIQGLMQKHPEADWLKECKAALPNASDGYILSTLEILSDGDVMEIESLPGTEEK